MHNILVNHGNHAQKRYKSKSCSKIFKKVVKSQKIKSLLLNPQRTFKIVQKSNCLAYFIDFRKLSKQIFWLRRQKKRIEYAWLVKKFNYKTILSKSEIEKFSKIQLNFRHLTVPELEIWEQRNYLLKWFVAIFNLKFFNRSKNY